MTTKQAETVIPTAVWEAVEATAKDLDLTISIADLADVVRAAFGAVPVEHPTRAALDVNARALADDNTRLRAINAGLRATIAARTGPTDGTTLTIDSLAEHVHDTYVRRSRENGVTSRLSPDGEEYMRPYADLSNAAKDLDRATVQAVINAINKSGHILVIRDVYDRRHRQWRDTWNDLCRIRHALTSENGDPEISMPLGEHVAPAVEWLVNDRNTIRAQRDQLAGIHHDRAEAAALIHRIHTAVGIPDKLREAIGELIDQVEKTPPVSPIAAFVGKWIAVKNGAVIADADTFPHLVDHLRETRQSADQTFQVAIHNPVESR